VVGRRVAVPFLERVDQPLARYHVGQHDRVAHVDADVVAGALEAEPVALFQGVPDVAGRLVAADVRLLRGGPGGARMFVIVAVPLVNLHNRFGDRVVVAPVGAHGGAAGVRGADAAEVLQVDVEDLRVGGAFLGGALQVASGQRPDAAL